LLSSAGVVVGSALLLLLAASEPSSSAAPRSARAELEECAARIEELKARHSDGVELERLLRRAQALAAEIERTSTYQSPDEAAPSPDELRERADAARDEADRLSSEIALLDVRIEDSRRAEPDDSVQRAIVSSIPVIHGNSKVRALLWERADLVARRARALTEAARLDEQARDAEREP